jgi:serine/threonine-protein kinase
VYAPPAPPPTGAPRRRGRKRAGWVAFFVVLLLAASAAVAGWYYGAGRYQSTPNVIGMSQASAAAKLRTSGLTLNVTSTAYSETVPDGELISTDPGPGQDVTKGGTVRAVISKGPERHNVPDVSGLSESEAVDALRARFLTVAPPTRAWSDTVPAGSVVSFIPKADTPLRRGGLVHLVISRGPRPIKIPNYIHKDASDARTALEALGFVVDPVPRYNDDVPAGSVVWQSPHDGTGARGDHIRLVVSEGPHLVKVPDVTQFGVAAAEDALTADGFQYDVQKNTPSFGLGFVVSQTPNGDSMAPYGSTVTIYIV